MKSNTQDMSENIFGYFPCSFVSVIVPVYNDASRLETCLDALMGQNYPSSLYEIIVIDNGSNDHLESIVCKYPGVRLLDEKRPGSYFARNAGIEAARGDVLAFTDSDCIPDKNWLACGVRDLGSDPRLGLVGGRIKFFFKDNSRPLIPELYDSITYLQQHNAVSRSRFAATANMFTRKKIMDTVGKFNAGLKSGGDRDWGERVAEAGFELRYSPDAVVNHPARATFSEIRKKSIRVSGGHNQVRHGKNSFVRFLELGVEVVWDLFPPVRFVFRVASDSRVRGVKNKILVTGFHMLAKYNTAWLRVVHYLGREPSRS